MDRVEWEEWALKSINPSVRVGGEVEEMEKKDDQGVKVVDPVKKEEDAPRVSSESGPHLVRCRPLLISSHSYPSAPPARYLSSSPTTPPWTPAPSFPTSKPTSTIESPTTRNS